MAEKNVDDVKINVEFSEEQELKVLNSGEGLSSLIGKLAKAVKVLIAHLSDTFGNKHIPAGGASGQILRWGADGTAVWGNDNNTTYSAMTGASASAAGTAGLVPAPAKGNQAKYLRGDGTWQTPPDTNTTYSEASQTAAGLMSVDDKKKLDGVAEGANNYTHPTSAGNKHIPSGGSSGQILMWSSAGTAKWGNVDSASNAEISVYDDLKGMGMSGTDSSKSFVVSYGGQTSTTTTKSYIPLPLVKWIVSGCYYLHFSLSVNGVASTEATVSILHSNPTITVWSTTLKVSTANKAVTQNCVVDISKLSGAYELKFSLKTQSGSVTLTNPLINNNPNA